MYKKNIFIKQVAQTDDVSRLDKEECATFLSECGLGVVLTMSKSYN